MSADRARATLVQRILAAIATVFGLVTIAEGTRVLRGADPGYIVFRPLLLFNVAMGVVYAAAGVIAWRNAHLGKLAAGAIFMLNLAVLGAIAYLYASGRAVAIDSVRAMTFRTVVWLALFSGLAWVDRRTRAPDA